jgi:hypothetical protein
VKGQPLALGVSEFHAQTDTVRSIGGHTRFDAQGTNLDYTLPLSQRVSWRGELWSGHNMSDMRGGIGQGFNATLGRLIRARGGWSELSLKVTRRWSVVPGVTVDDPNAADLSKGNRSRNMAYYVGNRLALDKAFLIGLDYLRWKTSYAGSYTAVDNRVDLFFQYGF